MTSRLLSLFIWAAVAASAAYWGLRLWVKPQAVPAQAVVASGQTAAVGDLSRLLGQAPVQVLAQPALVAAESRFRLVGVVAARAGQSGGLALISVDGKPPLAVGVGRELEPGLRLLSVSQRQADLGAGGSAPRLALTLPMLAEAARGRPGEAPGAAPAPMPVPGQFGGRPGLLPGGNLPGALPGGMVPGKAPPLPAGLPQRMAPLAPPGVSSRPVPLEPVDENAPAGAATR